MAELETAIILPGEAQPRLKIGDKITIRQPLFINTRNVKRERIPDYDNNRILVREYDVASDSIVEWYENADRA